MVTADQAKLVQSTWGAIKGKGHEAIGLQIFEKLFTKWPEFYGVFPYAKGFSAWKDLAPTPAMKNHANVVVAAIEKAVNGLGDQAKAVSELETLGKGHKGRKLSAEYLAHLGECFLATLESGLGGQWNAQTKDAWSAVYKVISDSMMKGFTS